ncbi:MAG: hypothetical protein IJN03_01650 [Bacilli bacterium]|nr:hypothetical protein [Bacilli bacterium]
MNLYVNNIIISNYKSDFLARYSIDTKTIYINYLKLIFAIGVDCSKRLFGSDYFHKLLYLNLHIIRVLLHEIEHIKQEEKMITGHNNFETKILVDASQLEKKLKENKLYSKDMYFVNPIERQAELQSCRIILNATEILSDMKLFDIIEKEYRELCVADYSFVNSICFFPLEKFWGINYISKYSKDYLFHHIDFNKRLDLGLEISQEEYCRIRDKI